MFRKTAVLLLFLLGMQTSHAQFVVGDAIPVQEKRAAQDILTKAAPKKLRLEVGEFEVLPQAKADPLTWYTIPLPGTSEACVQKVFRKAGESLDWYGKKRGDKEAKIHSMKFATPWLMVIGVQPGTYASVLFQNGATKDIPPAPVDEVEITVGDQPYVPPGPGPVVDQLQKRLADAYAKDKVAGIAKPEWASLLAGVYYSTSIDDISDIKTFDDLDAQLDDARKKSGLPDPDKALTNTRTQIRQEIFDALKLTADTDRSKAMTDANKDEAKKIFAKISTALKAIAK